MNRLSLRFFPWLFPSAGTARTMAVALLCLLLAAACARTQMARVMPDVQNMVTARYYFGEPSSLTQLPDGAVRYEWLLDRVTQQPGGIETLEIYVGHDSDGYREYIERDVYFPPYMEKQYCRLIITADSTGRVLSSSWQGRHCDALFRVDSAK